MQAFSRDVYFDMRDRYEWMVIPGVAREWKRVSEEGSSGRVSLCVMRRVSMSETRWTMSAGSASLTSGGRSLTDDDDEEGVPALPPTPPGTVVAAVVAVLDVVLVRARVRGRWLEDEESDEEEEAVLRLRGALASSGCCWCW